MSDPRVAVSDFTEALRAYQLRLAEWLGLDASLAFDMRETDVLRAEGLAPHLMTDVRWRSGDRPLPVEASEGRVPMPLCGESDGETTIFTNGVSLDGMETERMREAVGARPEMFTPEQALALDGLRWRAEH